jgi:hypothetical protein
MSNYDVIVIGVRAVRADSRASAATSIGIQKGIQPERKYSEHHR